MQALRGRYLGSGCVAESPVLQHCPSCEGLKHICWMNEAQHDVCNIRKVVEELWNSRDPHGTKGHVCVCACLCVWCVCVCTCVHKNRIQREIQCFWNDTGKISIHSEEAGLSGAGLESYKGGGIVTYLPRQLKKRKLIKELVALLSGVRNAYVSFGRREREAFSVLLRKQKET